MSAKREREYQELFAFVDFCATKVMGIAPANPNHPTNVGRRLVAEVGKSKALEGLRQATNDIVELLTDRPPEYVRALDAALLKAHVISASEVRRRYASAYKRVVKRGSIRNETEYYLVNGIVGDLT